MFWRSRSTCWSVRSSSNLSRVKVDLPLRSVADRSRRAGLRRQGDHPCRLLDSIERLVADGRSHVVDRRSIDGGVVEASREIAVAHDDLVHGVGVDRGVDTEIVDRVEAGRHERPWRRFIRCGDDRDETCLVDDGERSRLVDSRHPTDARRVPGRQGWVQRIPGGCMSQDGYHAVGQWSDVRWSARRCVLARLRARHRVRERLVGRGRTGGARVTIALDRHDEAAQSDDEERDRCDAQQTTGAPSRASRLTGRRRVMCLREGVHRRRDPSLQLVGAPIDVDVHENPCSAWPTFDATTT